MPRLAVPVLVVVACVAVAAALRVVTADHSGTATHPSWTPAVRRELGLAPVRRTVCRREEPAPGEIALQNRVEDRLGEGNALWQILGRRWGSLWYDTCDGGRLGVGVSPRPAAQARRQLARARAYVRRLGLERDVRFVAVTATYRELVIARDRLLRRFERVFDQGMLTLGIDTSRNAVVVELARPIAAEDRAAVRMAARQAPAPVLVEQTNAHDFFAVAD